MNLVRLHAANTRTIHELRALVRELKAQRAELLSANADLRTRIRRTKKALEE